LKEVLGNFASSMEPDVMTPPASISTLSADAPSTIPFPRVTDGQLADRVVAALRAYEDALNAAHFAGLPVEARFERVRDRLPGVEDSFVAMLSIRRRPSAEPPRRTTSSRMAASEAGGD
jgi:hypothetical protein